ncbi:MAG: metallopeptidase TldD-related protein [Planctomycetota bacterium]|nr:metallopeptidase TldD-related protein [Planctomycetota bacterium]
MQRRFFEYVDELSRTLRGKEVLLASYDGEESDFVRFNRSAIRQPGSVMQQYVTLELIDGRRHAKAATTVTGQADDDRAALKAMLVELRAQLPHVPDDPYLLYATEVHNTEQIARSTLPDSGAALDKVLAAGQGRDMVGLYAAGGIYGGFANSLGQKNWYASHSFCLEWCFYHQADKAVKARYAGLAWDDGAFARKVADATSQLEVLQRPAKTIAPGGYRVFLTPAAMVEIASMLAWSGFGLKDHRTKNTSLLKMIEGHSTLAPAITVRENVREGLGANFTGEGFVKAPVVMMIENGRYKDCLVSPRSSAEYGVPVNAGWEYPSSFEMGAGDLDEADVLARLDTGVYVNTLWYLNYSDRPAGRITGMTRFATFWVEGGRVTAPLNVMRFDETYYRILGTNLLALTRQRDFIPATDTYQARSTSSHRLPGALIDDFQFTL